MDRSERVQPLSRLGGAFGIAFAILFFFGMTLLSSVPDIGSSAAKINAYYASSSHRTTLFIGVYLLALAGVCFLGFLGHLYRTLAAADPERGGLAATALAAGGVFVALLLTAGALFGATATAMLAGGTPQPSAEVAGMLPQIAATILLIPGMFAAIAMLVAGGVIALRTDALPAWYAWFSFIASVILLGGVVFMPMMALPIWALVTSIVMLRGVQATGRSSIEQRTSREAGAA